MVVGKCLPFLFFFPFFHNKLTCSVKDLRNVINYIEQTRPYSSVLVELQAIYYDFLKSENEYYGSNPLIPRFNVFAVNHKSYQNQGRIDSLQLTFFAVFSFRIGNWSNTGVIVMYMRLFNECG